MNCFVGPSVGPSVGPLDRKKQTFFNISYTLNRIETNIGVVVNIDKGKILALCQDHRVKGQSQINGLVKN